MWKINFSNGVYLDPELNLKKPYKVYIGGGNNSLLIKSLFKRRFWWTIVDSISDDTNFIWTQLKVPSVFRIQREHDSKPSDEKTTVCKKSITTSTIETKLIILKETKTLSNPNHTKIFKGNDL